MLANRFAKWFRKIFNRGGGRAPFTKTRLRIEELEVRDCPTVAPVIGSLQLSDMAPKTNDMLTVSVIDPTDGDNHAIEFKYDWYVNSNLVQTLTTSSTSNSLDLSQSGLGDKTDDIWVIVTPQDAHDIGTPVTSSTATVANSAPTDIDLSANSIIENRPSDSAVGSLSASDADGDLISYTLVSGEGGADNTSFIIDGTTLKTTASFDFETKASYFIRVRATDASSAVYEETFTINVTDEIASSCLP